MLRICFVTASLPPSLSFSFLPFLPSLNCKNVLPIKIFTTMEGSKARDRTSTLATKRRSLQVLHVVSCQLQATFAQNKASAQHLLTTNKTLKHFESWKNTLILRSCRLLIDVWKPTLILCLLMSEWHDRMSLRCATPPSPVLTEESLSEGQNWPGRSAECTDLLSPDLIAFVKACPRA